MTALLDRRQMFRLTAATGAALGLGALGSEQAQAVVPMTKRELTTQERRRRRRRRKRRKAKLRRKRLRERLRRSQPQPTPTPDPPPAPDPEPSPSIPGDAAFAHHLLRRTTFGITTDLVAELSAAGGAHAWLDRQLAPDGIDDDACTAALASWPLATTDPPTNYASMGNGHWDSMEDVVRATLARQLWSKRQLFEVMVEFWSNHLNITCPSSEVWATKSWDDVHVIRAHALGRFEDMLQASVTSPAMLLYLNNAKSRGDDVNENYARELLELHTVGVDGGYAHADIVDAARTLSGLSVWTPWNGGTEATVGTFRYVSAWHYVGPVSVLGWSHANGNATNGVAVVRSLVSYLARHPMTARRIATKLAVRFVADDPPAALVDQLAQVYLDNDTAVKPVLRALFASPAFAAAAGQKVRRPAEDVVAAWRATGIAPDPHSATRDGAVAGLRWLLGELGNAPHGWGLPDGYPDVARRWGGAGLTLNRWNAHMATTQQWWADGVIWPDLATHLLGASTPSTRGAVIDALLERLLPGHQVSAAHRAALIAFLGTDGPVQNGDTTWLFPVLVALVLDSPYWSIR